MSSCAASAISLFIIISGSQRAVFAAKRLTQNLSTFKVQRPSLSSEKVGDQLARSATVRSVFCKQGFPWASMDDCLHMMQLTKQRLESTLAQNIKELEAGLQTWIGGKLLFKKSIALEADLSTEESLMLGLAPSEKFSAKQIAATVTECDIVFWSVANGIVCRQLKRVSRADKLVMQEKNDFFRRAVEKGVFPNSQEVKEKLDQKGVQAASSKKVQRFFGCVLVQMRKEVDNKEEKGKGVKKGRFDKEASDYGSACFAGCEKKLPAWHDVPTQPILQIRGKVVSSGGRFSGGKGQDADEDVGSSSQTSAATVERQHAPVVLCWSSDFLAQFIKLSVVLLQDFDEDTRAEAVQIVCTHRLSGCSLWDRQNACLANFSGQMLDLWRCIKILVDPVGGKMMAEMEEEAGVGLDFGF
eukprot:1086883-Rhodomonas_salina.1